MYCACEASPEAAPAGTSGFERGGEVGFMVVEMMMMMMRIAGAMCNMYRSLSLSLNLSLSLSLFISLSFVPLYMMGSRYSFALCSHNCCFQLFQRTSGDFRDSFRMCTSVRGGHDLLRISRY